MLFLTLVLVPALRGLEDKRLASGLVQAAGRRFRTVGWITLAVLAVTGIGNLHGRGIPLAKVFEPSFVFENAFGHVLITKIILFLFVIMLSLVHDFIVGPKASNALVENPNDPKALRLKMMASWFGRFNMVLALAIAFCGVMMVRGRPW